MKLKASKSEIREKSYYIFSAGYCEIDYLLRPVEPFSYCSGIYGWSCDNYEINTGRHRITISTGYNPLNDKNIKLDKEFYKITRKYNEKARKINQDAKNWQEAQKRLLKLLYNFIDKEIFKESI